MENLLRLLEPRSLIGLFVRALFFVSLIIGANFAFAILHEGTLAYIPSVYVAHGFTVGGPFVAFFFFIMVQQIKLQRRLSHLSRKDGLTGLNNRRTFFDMTERRQKSDHNGVLLLLDADNFKHINDTYGHSVGDECLKAIAYRLNRNLRDDDVVGRIGGEEFAVFLSGTSLAQARVIGERLTQPIPFTGGPDHPHLSVTLSAGAVLAASDLTLDSLLLRADDALYQAKSQGRARMVVWRGADDGPAGPIAVGH